MRVFQLENDWGIQNLRLSTRPDPKAGRGQVIIKMAAASLNYRDLVVLDRGYGRSTGTLPLILLSDGAGTVVETGPEVTRVKVGDRVCPTFFQSWIGGSPQAQSFLKPLGGALDGVMADFICLAEDGMVKVPETLSFEEAATLPCAALTAWSAVVTNGKVKAGDHVLVQGSGGVALFALAFAKLHGAHVTVISSSDDKLARLRSLGADHGINYTTTPEWDRATRDITSERGGFDNIIELGGEKTLQQSLRSVRPGGTISLIGVLSGIALSASLGAIVSRHVRLQGITVGSRDSFEDMLRAINLHHVRPVIDRCFAFGQLVDALEYLRAGRHFGKVVIQHG